MRIVIIESPYAGDIEKNLRYLRAAMRDCLMRGEAPYASHGLYTQAGVLCDEVPRERDLGIQASSVFRRFAARTVVYADLGITEGMKKGIEHASSLGQEIEFRSLAAEVWS